MQRGRGPRRVFIWGNGNQAAHKAAPRPGRALSRPGPGRRAPTRTRRLDSADPRGGQESALAAEPVAVCLEATPGPSLGRHT